METWWKSPFQWRLCPPTILYWRSAGGLGTLTSHLLNLGHTVYAVEIDRRLEAHLRERLNSFIESGQFNLVRQMR